LTIKTKVTKLGPSKIIVIPHALADVMHIEKGDTMEWDIKIVNNEHVITLIHHKKKNRTK
jgi:antitoxin component of MazEF toxin-antitoxin module